jgi:hypothetical protein
MPDEPQHFKFMMSNFYILRTFALWGILDSLVFILFKGDRFKALIIFVLIFTIMSIYGIVNPGIVDFI